MAAPIVDSIYYAGNSFEGAAHGGNGLLAYKLAVNRGTVNRVPSRIVSGGGARTGNPTWSWNDNWPGYSGPPLVGLFIAQDNDARYGLVYYAWNIPSSGSYTVLNAPAPSGGDDYTALQNDLTNIGTHVQYNLQPNATYQVSNNWLVLDQKTDVIVNFNGATLTRTNGVNTTGRGQLEITRSTAIQVWGPGTIVGSYPTLQYSADIIHGIRNNGSTHVWVSPGMVAQNVTGESYYMSRYQNSSAPYPEYATVQGMVNSTRSDRQGYTVDAGVVNSPSVAWFINCVMLNSRLVNFDMEVGDGSVFTRSSPCGAIRIIEPTLGPGSGASISLGGAGWKKDIIVANPNDTKASGAPFVQVSQALETYLYNFRTGRTMGGPNGAIYIQTTDPVGNEGLYIQSASFSGLQNQATGGVVFDGSGGRHRKIRTYDSRFAVEPAVYGTITGQVLDAVQANNTLV